MEQRRWLFVSLLLGNFLQNLLTSLQGPLYPPEAEEKGMRPTMYGLVMSFYRVVLAISSVLVGVNAERFNMQKLLVFGLTLDGVTAILFGSLGYVVDYSLFTTFSFVLRGLEGIASVAIQFSIYSIIPVVRPDTVAMANGLAVTSDLLGLSFGPLFGTLLASQLGFSAPFFMFGLIQVAVGFKISCENSLEFSKSTLAPTPPKSLHLIKPYFKILRQNPTVLVFVFACFAAGVGPDFLSAVLEPGIRHFQLTQIQVGLTFFYTAILQLGAPVWGSMLDKMKRSDLFLGCSSILMVVALGMIGPLSEIQPTYGLTVVGLILFGLAQGAVAVGSLASLRNEVTKYNSPVNLVQISFISTVLLCGTSFGEGISAGTAGFLFENFGFSIASLFPLGVHLCLILMLLVCIVKKKLCHVNFEETDPLLL